MCGVEEIINIQPQESQALPGKTGKQHFAQV